MGRVGEALLLAGNPDLVKKREGEKMSESVPNPSPLGRPSENPSPTLPPSRVLNVGVQV